MGQASKYPGPDAPRKSCRAPTFRHIGARLAPRLCDIFRLPKMVFFTCKACIYIKISNIIVLFRKSWWENVFKAKKLDKIKFYIGSLSEGQGHLWPCWFYHNVHWLSLHWWACSDKVHYEQKHPVYKWPSEFMSIDLYSILNELWLLKNNLNLNFSILRIYYHTCIISYVCTIKYVTIFIIYN